MTGIIQGRGLRKSYSGDGAVVHALDGVDIDVEEGAYLGIMGPSGCGKSTLLHMLGALDEADEGEVIVGGRTLADLSRAELAAIRRRHVGFVFQFFNLVGVLTVEENVALPLRLDGTHDPSRVDEVLASLGLGDKRTKLPSALSGGEQQRVAIARAIVNRPQVLLADEPTGNLDRQNGRDVMAALQRLHDAGQTVVVVTHDPIVAAQAQRVVFMRDGRLIGDVPITTSGDPAPVLARLTELEL